VRIVSVVTTGEEYYESTVNERMTLNEGVQVVAKRKRKKERERERAIYNVT
jgi:hypothetical protein